MNGRTQAIENCKAIVVVSPPGAQLMVFQCGCGNFHMAISKNHGEDWDIVGNFHDENAARATMFCLDVMSGMTAAIASDGVPQGEVVH